jgi:hypothetical protein
MTKRIYITEGLITYSIQSRQIETNSNYDTTISIKMVGERFPAWGGIIKSTDNVRKFAKRVIKSWVK